MCYNGEVIDLIGKNKNFVKTILYYLNADEPQLLRQIMKILYLVTCEIQINSDSEWIFRLKECEYFGSRIISLLKFPSLNYVVKTETHVKLETGNNN